MAGRDSDAGGESDDAGDESDDDAGDESVAAGPDGGGSARSTTERVGEPVVRRYEPRDRAAIQRIHDAAMRAAGTDPADIPGNDDLERVEATYIEPGGEFLVVEAASDTAGCTSVTNFATPGRRISSSYSRQYDDPDTDETGRAGADADREVVAMGGLAVEDEDLAPGEGELFRIAVDPARQREGHGSRILSGLENAARERSIERIVLTTAKRQAAATAFYPAHGYEEVGRERVDEYELVRFEKSIE